MTNFVQFVEEFSHSLPTLPPLFRSVHDRELECLLMATQPLLLVEAELQSAEAQTSISVIPLPFPCTSASVLLMKFPYFDSAFFLEFGWLQVRGHVLMFIELLGNPLPVSASCSIPVEFSLSPVFGCCCSVCLLRFC